MEPIKPLLDKAKFDKAMKYLEDARRDFEKLTGITLTVSKELKSLGESMEKNRSSKFKELINKHKAEQGEQHSLNEINDTLEELGLGKYKLTYSTNEEAYRVFLERHRVKKIPDLVFTSVGTERMRIDAEGNLGIGDMRGSRAIAEVPTMIIGMERTYENPNVIKSQYPPDHPNCRSVLDQAMSPAMERAKKLAARVPTAEDNFDFWRKK